MKKTIFTVMGRMKKGGWKKWADQINVIDRELVVCYNKLIANNMSIADLYSAFTNCFNEINTEILSIKLIDDKTARDIVDFNEKILNQIFFTYDREIKEYLTKRDIKYLEDMLCTLLTLGRSKMKDIDTIYQQLLTIYLLSDSQEKLRSIGINIE